MFIFNFKTWELPDINKFKENIKTESLMLSNQIDSQHNNKESVYKKFINLPIYEKLTLEDPTVLAIFNGSFLLIDSCIEKLENLQKTLNSLEQFINETNFKENFNRDEFLVTLQDKLEEYYSSKNTIQLESIEAEKNIKDILSKIEADSSLSTSNSFKITERNIKINKEDTSLTSDKKTLKIENTVNNKKENNILPKKQIENTKPKKISSPIEEKINISEKIDQPIKDNKTLLISEKENKIFLPYRYKTLEMQLANDTKYSSIQEIIDNEYILPLDKFKSSPSVRFREGFKLMREKENCGFIESVSLGFELMREYKLNPAIIAACQNENELDLYLDCLDENRPEDFTTFDIVFDMSPLTTKNT